MTSGTTRERSISTITVSPASDLICGQSPPYCRFKQCIGLGVIDTAIFQYAIEQCPVSH